MSGPMMNESLRLAGHYLQFVATIDSQLPMLAIDAHHRPPGFHDWPFLVSNVSNVSYLPLGTISTVTGPFTRYYYWKLLAISVSLHPIWPQCKLSS